MHLFPRAWSKFPTENLLNVLGAHANCLVCSHTGGYASFFVCVCVVECCRAVSVLLRRALVPLAVGRSSARWHGGVRPAPQSPAAVLLRQSAAHPRRHLGARLRAALSGPHPALCAHLQLAGHPR